MLDRFYHFFCSNASKELKINGRDGVTINLNCFLRVSLEARDWSGNMLKYAFIIQQTCAVYVTYDVENLTKFLFRTLTIKGDNLNCCHF